MPKILLSLKVGKKKDEALEMIKRLQDASNVVSQCDKDRVRKETGRWLMAHAR